MATARAPMLTNDHAAKTLEFLTQSDAEFAEGDRLQASEKLWGAATHAVIAVAQQRAWRHGSHRAMKEAVTKISDEHDDIGIKSGFAAAEKFHSNFYHDHMEDFDLDDNRPRVQDFVHRVLALL